MKNILVVGSLNMDLVIQTDRMPAQGETLHGYGFSSIPGGKGANQAAAAAKLGCSVQMLGGIGGDAYGKTLKKHLQTCGVGTEHLKICSGSSGVAVITVCDGDNRILLDSGANQQVTPQYLEHCVSLFSWADMVVLQLEIPMESVETAAFLAKTAGAAVLLNPAPFQAVSPSLLARTDWLILNETEAAAMCQRPVSNREEAYFAAQKIKEQFSGQVILTLGKAGCLYFENEKWKQMPAFPVKTVDTTAAGDCFIGALCASLEDASALTESVRFASAAAAVTVSRMGAGSSIPTRAEVMDFLRKNNEI